MLIKIIKKLIVALVLLFGYNTLLSSLNIIIPINYITIVFVAIFDISGVIGLVIFYLMNF